MHASYASVSQVVGRRPNQLPQLRNVTCVPGLEVVNIRKLVSEMPGVGLAEVVAAAINHCRGMDRFERMNAR